MRRWPLLAGVAVRWMLLVGVAPRWVLAVCWTLPVRVVVCCGPVATVAVC
ncbi:hypothetical protein F4560_001933 [Saccharothrix ecbatanensis]|uniref:Uncharacterized protein n=1 Tax=Saccharothrix ecbatanensis TaxID=1105145 RepID=A0A7W9LZQ9_9PSEU|nr:hypothetical protein [Saccharothrix ecbatanensis]MBB5802165.1 hypothetical protein [Saccharothrix ecbatanensis]